jgi:adenosylhomocysteine nucleosidase
MLQASLVRIALVCAMPMEARPLRARVRGRDDVVVGVTGMGTALAREGTTRLLDSSGGVDRVVVVGITGALEDETPIGTLVNPEVVVNENTGGEYRPAPLLDGDQSGVMWTTDRMITGADELADLRARGVVSLDMETAAIGEVCEGRGVPWSVVRAISDRASDGSVDAEVFAMSNQDGTPNPRAVARYLLRHPGRIPQLVRLGRGANLARRAAAEAALRALGLA